MHARLFCRTIAGTLCALGLAGGTPAQTGGSEKLFSIARSTNANIVRYDAQRTADGQLNLARPMIAYWIMLAENGRREELTWLEREFAYGFSIAGVTPAGFTLRVAAFKQREIRVVCTKLECRARAQIGTAFATLKQVYVSTDNGSPVPSVRYLELRGTTDNGSGVVERIKAP